MVMYKFFSTVETLFDILFASASLSLMSFACSGGDQIVSYHGAASEGGEVAGEIGARWDGGTGQEYHCQCGAGGWYGAVHR